VKSNVTYPLFFAVVTALLLAYRVGVSLAKAESS